MSVAIKHGGHTLKAKDVSTLVAYGIEKNTLASIFICQLYYESNWGNSTVAQNNNNWGGLTWTGNPNRPSGIKVTRGMKRPSNEGGYYMHFQSVADYLYDYVYLLTDQGIYNVKGKSNFNEAVKGLFKAGGAKANYAATHWETYVNTMVSIRNSINNGNNNILTKIENNPENYTDEEDIETPDPSEPNDPEIPDDFDGIDVAGFVKELNQLITDMLTKDIFKSGQSEFSQNEYIQLMNQLENTFKIKPNKKFFEKIQEKFKDFNDSYIPDDSGGTEPDPEPTGDFYFPVKLNTGINFWKRKNWGVGTLQRNMTYGKRSSGRYHNGYDIGSGGNSGYGVYAVRDGTVTHVETRGTAGFVIAIKHDTDEYHSLYMHLVTNSNLVYAGDKVKAGQKIATMGQTGGNYAIHLHIEISKTGQFHSHETTSDPEKYLQVVADNKTNLKIP